MNGKDLYALISQGLVIDLETTLRHNPGTDGGSTFKGTPHSPANFIVALRAKTSELLSDRNIVGEKWLGYTTTGGIESLTSYNEVEECVYNIVSRGAVNGGLLIGHNIGFDLQYIMYCAECDGRITPETRELFLSRINIWDTMIAQFYLTRQDITSPGLEASCLRRNIDFKKSDTVTESFQAGIGSELIDKSTLLEYLEEDVNATETLFLLQHQEALRRGGPGYVNYLINMMGARIATMTMESNGIHIDTHLLERDREKLGSEHEILTQSLAREMERSFPTDRELTINPESNLQIQTYLFGGTVPCSKEIPYRDEDGTPILYKTGPKKGTVKLKKYKYVSKVDGVLAHTKTVNLLKAYPKDTGEKNLGDLLNVCNLAGHAWGSEVIKTILKIRKLSKELHTYYEGLGKQVWKHDSKIRPNYNHAIAATKRTTSSGPNMQNVSNKIVENEE